MIRHEPSTFSSITIWNCWNYCFI